MNAAAQNVSTDTGARPRRDRRDHHRVSIAVEGRFMHGEQDHPLVVENISCGGGLFRARSQPDVNTPIICYLDGLGRVPALITRKVEHGFAVRFDTTKHKKDKLADQLTFLANYKKYGLSIESLRSAPRKQASGQVLIQRANGRKIQCRVIDISLTGAAFKSPAGTPVLGEMVQVGKLRGEVVRSAGSDFAVRFLHGPKA